MPRWEASARARKLGRPRVVVGLVSASGLAFARLRGVARRGCDGLHGAAWAKVKRGAIYVVRMDGFVQSWLVGLVWRLKGHFFGSLRLKAATVSTWVV